MIVWSYSRLEAFDKCPRQYAYRYVERAPKGREGVEAFMGSRVHDVLEELHRTMAGEGKPATIEEARDLYSEVWHAKLPHEGLEVARRGDTVAGYFSLGLRCLEHYYARDLVGPSRPGWVHAGVEVELRWVMGGHTFVGFIDRLESLIDQRGHWFKIHDYKTGARPLDQAGADADDQLAIYHLGLARRERENTPATWIAGAQLVWHFLRIGLVVKSMRSKPQLLELEARTVARVEKVLKAEEAGAFPANPSPLCRWCNYKAICPEAKL